MSFKCKSHCTYFKQKVEPTLCFNMFTKRKMQILENKKSLVTHLYSIIYECRITSKYKTTVSYLPPGIKNKWKSCNFETWVIKASFV